MLAILRLTMSPTCTLSTGPVVALMAGGVEPPGAGPDFWATTYQNQLVILVFADIVSQVGIPHQVSPPSPSVSLRGALNLPYPNLYFWSIQLTILTLRW